MSTILKLSPDFEYGEPWCRALSSGYFLRHTSLFAIIGQVWLSGALMFVPNSTRLASLCENVFLPHFVNEATQACYKYVPHHWKGSFVIAKDSQAEISKLRMRRTQSQTLDFASHVIGPVVVVAADVAFSLKYYSPDNQRQCIEYAASALIEIRVHHVESS